MNPVTMLAIKDIHPKWKHLLNSPTKSGKTLIELLDDTLTAVIATKAKLCPDSPGKILRCLHLDPDLIKCVIVGQEPYPQPGIATGLAFGCNDTIQPSLNIILRELIKEYPFMDDTFDISLEQWEKQGVLLLNSSLSCEQFKPGSHSKLWEPFMTGLFEILDDFKLTRESTNSLVFVFLGKQAQLFEALVSEAFHYKIMRYHPAAETHGSCRFEGFFGEVNKCLIQSNQETIGWEITK